jgi:hypothetical protein
MATARVTSLGPRRTPLRPSAIIVGLRVVAVLSYLLYFDYFYLPYMLGIWLPPK